MDESGTNSLPALDCVSDSVDAPLGKKAKLELQALPTEISCSSPPPVATVNGYHAVPTQEGTRSEFLDQESDDEVVYESLYVLTWEAKVPCFCKRAEFTWKGLTLSEDSMTITGHLGYGLARGTHGFVEGCWYYEVTVLHDLSEGNCRLGWAQSRNLTQIQAYPGFDQWSYGYRDKQGTYFHKARAAGQGQPYTKGDVIGILLFIPEGFLTPELLSKYIFGIRKREYESATARFRRKTLENQCVANQLQQPVPDSCILFFKNGQAQRIAFTEVFHGVWYPAVGLYKHAKVRVNFGPDFAHFPSPAMVPEKIPTPRPVAELNRIVVFDLGDSQTAMKTRRIRQVSNKP